MTDGTDAPPSSPVDPGPGEAPGKVDLPGYDWQSVVVPAAIVAVAAVALSVVLLLLPIGFGFSLDGQTVVDKRLPMTWGHLLKPFHQHLDLVPILIWDRMAVVFGTASSTPYLAFLLGTHVVLATATTAALARRIGSVFAVAFGLPLALLGSSYFNLIAPWQILFTPRTWCIRMRSARRPVP